MVPGVLSGSYIYLDCLRRSPHKQGKQGEHLTPHGLHHNLMNTYIKYLWYLFLSDHNITPPPGPGGARWLAMNAGFEV